MKVKTVVSAGVLTLFLFICIIMMCAGILPVMPTIFAISLATAIVLWKMKLVLSSLPAIFICFVMLMATMFWLADKFHEHSVHSERVANASMPTYPESGQPEIPPDKYWIVCEAPPKSAGWSEPIIIPMGYTASPDTTMPFNKMVNGSLVREHLLSHDRKKDEGNTVQFQSTTEEGFKMRVFMHMN
jgi:hypothetical protein